MPAFPILKSNFKFQIPVTVQPAILDGCICTRPSSFNSVEQTQLASFPKQIPIQKQPSPRTSDENATMVIKTRMFFSYLLKKSGLHGFDCTQTNNSILCRWDKRSVRQPCNTYTVAHIGHRYLPINKELIHLKK